MKVTTVNNIMSTLKTIMKLTALATIAILGIGAFILLCCLAFGFATLCLPGYPSWAIYSATVVLLAVLYSVKSNERY